VQLPVRGKRTSSLPATIINPGTLAIKRIDIDLGESGHIEKIDPNKPLTVQTSREFTLPKGEIILVAVGTLEISGFDALKPSGNPRTILDENGRLVWVN